MKKTHLALAALLLLGLVAFVLGCGPADESVQRQIGNMAVVEPPSGDPQQDDGPEEGTPTPTPTPTPEPVVECVRLPEVLQQTEELAENQEWRDGVKFQCFTYEATPTPKYPSLERIGQFAQIAEATKAAQESKGNGDGAAGEPETEENNLWVIVYFDTKEDLEAQMQWFQDNRVTGGENDEKFRAIPGHGQVEVVLPASVAGEIADMEGFIHITFAAHEYTGVPTD